MSLESQFLDVQKNIKRLADNQAALGQLKDLLAQNIQKEQELMSKITDWAAQEQADLSAISNTLDTVVTGITALDALRTVPAR